MTAQELLWAYFRAPEGGVSEKRFARQFDKIIETGKKLPVVRRLKSDLRTIRKAYRIANKDRFNLWNRLLRSSNPERYADYQKKYVGNNKEKVARWKSDWRKRNIEKAREANRRWRAKKFIDTRASN